MAEAKRLLLVATDFSEAAERAVDEAVEMALRLGADVELVHVFDAHFGALPAPARDELAATVRRNVDEALATLAAGVRARGPRCTVAAVECARPWQGIVRRAEETAPLFVVVGTHGRTGLGHALLGSVAEQVVRHACFPVVVVPTRQAPLTQPSPS